MLSKCIASGGLLFAFEHSTVAGKIVLLTLAIGSIFSWSVMITKMRVIRFARKQTARFLEAFRQDRQPLHLVERNARFVGAPIFNVYRAGCQELAFHLLGSAEVDETFRARLGVADKITPDRLGLYKLEVKSGHREILFCPKKSPKPIRIEVSRLSGNLFKIEVEESLEPGEYSLSPADSNQVFCFQVY